ncbi:CoA transferase [Streptosporangium roseum]|uniref:Acyl-CoA transferase/carnitine dehydratase n=1 Tax=Streptosporangium roseum (strain ATCC 12428 / DSM 43021 / JCM 3005 / KCTC 9067 / NCIMB 10171 / NRRL 2505 / NI 9100) TaxID=479432 RepID=D2BF50_STRRD|nr:CoA transferase [Streptosporangium roseum]ACZ86411.1 acyl-CoA transferase/carnitine dehydratase [Streptosporangium roseum DSM 43021]
MAHPATARAAHPLAGIGLRTAGSPALTTTVAHHLTLLGAAGLGSAASDGPGAVSLTGAGGLPLTAAIAWAAVAPADEVTDEATAQAATGVACVHGRRSGEPRGLAVDYLTTACAVLAVQGLLAGLIGRARGSAVETVRTGVDLAGLLSVGQYLAAADAEDDEAVPFAPGGPPFTTADGVCFEVETLDPAVWVAFWQALGVAGRLAGSAWRSFQFRYATACSPLPEELRARVHAVDWESVRRAAKESGASLCALRSLRDRLAEPRAREPWRLSPGLPAPLLPPSAEVARPLAGLTVLEAGRRIQAPLAAYVLGLLGADVVRIEPPGGDPLRGMPPTCGDLSARWLALNRGKHAVEIDIKSAAGRAELRDLVRGADVFVHNWAPGTAERLGLDDGDLSAVNPGLVYAYTSGWAGRLADAPLGTDFMVQARTGLGEAVRPAGEPPAPSLMTLLDVLGGLLGAEAILAGLLLREREGRGVRVDSSLLGAAETLTGPALRRAAAGADPRRPAGFRRPLPTADGWVAVADDCAEQANAAALTGLDTAEAVTSLRRRGLRATAVTTALDRLPSDPRFTSALTRDEHGALAVPVPWRFA